jgi:ubiquinone/menaquinone biosynthesis C-methylase UbiE
MFHPNGPTFFELARQALASTERGYDLLAPKFDYTPYRTPDTILNAAAVHIGKPNSIVAALDICCGTGAAMKILRPLCRNRVIGIDISHGMLEVAGKQTLATKGEAQLQFVRGDVLDMLFEAEFDIVTCFGALGHILPKDQLQFIGQIALALKPGGRFIFVTSYMPPIWSKKYWLLRGFNTVMHIRNLIIRPPFIIYYLTFLLPEAKEMLKKRGFAVEVKDLFEEKFTESKLVVATLHK